MVWWMMDQFLDFEVVVLVVDCLNVVVNEVIEVGCVLVLVGLVEVELLELFVGVFRFYFQFVVFGQIVCVVECFVGFEG